MARKGRRVDPKRRHIYVDQPILDWLGRIGTAQGIPHLSPTIEYVVRQLEKMEKQHPDAFRALMAPDFGRG